MLKWLFRLVVLVVVVWFAETVQLGRHSLLGHLFAIAHTRAAKDLADGTKEAGGQLARRVRQELRADGGVERGRPDERLDDRDRAGLQKLVKERGR